MQDVIEIKKCFEFLVVGLAVMVLIALLGFWECNWLNTEKTIDNRISICWINQILTFLCCIWSIARAGGGHCLLIVITMSGHILGYSFVRPFFFIQRVESKCFINLNYLIGYGSQFTRISPHPNIKEVWEDRDIIRGNWDPVNQIMVSNGLSSKT